MLKNRNENISYLPLQPGFEINKDYYIRVEKDLINKNIMIFYQFKMDSSSANNSILVVPDGCVDIIFSYNPRNIFANCCGTVLQSKKIIFKSDYEYFGVRYLAEQGIFLMKDLIESEIPLLDLITGDRYIVEKIANARSFAERVDLFNIFMAASTSEFALVPKLVKYSIERIYQAKGNINMDQLAMESGYSVRYLRKKFEDIIGMPPKFFSEIVRFQNSLSMIIKKDEYSLWDVISETGYYDQAHFINQFKKFSTLTPVKFKETFAKNTNIY